MEAHKELSLPIVELFSWEAKSFSETPLEPIVLGRLLIEKKS